MTYGLDSTGLTVARLADLITDDDAVVLAQLGAGAARGTDKPLSLLLGIQEAAVAEGWAELQKVYDARVLANATGVALKNLADLAGLTPRDATYSTVTLTLTGTAGTVVPIGSLVQDLNQYIWSLDATYTIGGGGTVTALATCTTAGAVAAGAASITSIVTSVTNWTGVTNAADATEGTEAELDPQLRARILLYPQTAGSATVDAIHARLLDADSGLGLTQALVLENTTDAVDANGLPAHSIEAVCYPDNGQDADIAALLWLHKPGGISTHGDESQSVVDTQGFSHVVEFSWASLVYILADIVIDVDATLYPSDGDQQIADLVEAYIEGRTMGQDVYLYGVQSAFATVPGVINLTSVELSRKPAATAASNVTILFNEIADVQTASTDITVTSTAI